MASTGDESTSSSDSSSSGIYIDLFQNLETASFSDSSSGSGFGISFPRTVDKTDSFSDMSSVQPDSGFINIPLPRTPPCK